MQTECLCLKSLLLTTSSCWKAWDRKAGTGLYNIIFSYFFLIPSCAVHFPCTSQTPQDFQQNNSAGFTESAHDQLGNLFTV